jgi:hypothetical protein
MTLNEIRQRDAVLHALDALTIGILGDEWSVVSHMGVKTMLLNLIDKTGDNK